MRRDVAFALLAIVQVWIAPAASADTVIAIKAGRILPITAPAITNGTVLIRNGKIVAIGKNIAIPPGATLIDARASVVMPGLVAAASGLGGSAEPLEAIAPDFRSIDGYDVYTDHRLMLEEGITTAYIGAGNRRLVRGQGCAVKLAGQGPNARILRNSVDVSVVLGAYAKNPPALFKPPIPPTDDNPILPSQRQMSSVRPSEYAILRQLFSEAKRAQSGTLTGAAPTSENVSLLQSERNPPPARDNRKFRALFPILSGKLPLRVRADTAADIRHAIEFADSLHLNLVIEGGAEAYRLGAELARRQIPVISIAEARPGARMDKDLRRDDVSGRFRPDTAALLAKAGVTVSIAAENESNGGDPLALAAMQVSYGMGRDPSLRALTINPARALGVQSRVGSLEVGKDADLLVLSGDPLETSTHVEMTLVNGAVAYKQEQASPSGALIAIRAGRILTVSQGEIANGTVLVRAGKIVAVRRGWDVPEGAVVIDASHSTVMPGMIDAYTYIGLHSDADPVPIDIAAAQAGPSSGRTKLLNALTPSDGAFADALRAGVTEALLAPPTTAAFCGSATLLKTIDDSRNPLAKSRRVVKESAAVCFNFTGGAPRRTQSWTFRELLQSAKSYNQRRMQYNQDYKDWQRDRDTAKLQGKDIPKEPAEVVPDDDLEPLAPLFRGEVPAFVHATRADEIVNAVKLFRDEFDLPMTLVDGQDCFRITDEIRKRGVSVALGPDVMAMDRGRPINDADVLSRANIPILFQSSSVSGSAFLRLNAAAAVRNGLDPVEALRALTIYAARALRVESRLGSIEAGKDADLVILSGDPLNMASRVERVMVDGKVVFNAR